MLALASRGKNRGQHIPRNPLPRNEPLSVACQSRRRRHVSFEAFKHRWCENPFSHVRNHLPRVVGDDHIGRRRQHGDGRGCGVGHATQGGTRWESRMCLATPTVPHARGDHRGVSRWAPTREPDEADPPPAPPCQGGGSGYPRSTRAESRPRSGGGTGETQRRVGQGRLAAFRQMVGPLARE